MYMYIVMIDWFAYLNPLKPYLIYIDEVSHMYTFV